MTQTIWTEEVIQEVLRLQSEGKTYAEIGPMYGSTKNGVQSAVRDYRKKHGIKVPERVVAENATVEELTPEQRVESRKTALIENTRNIIKAKTDKELAILQLSKEVYCHALDTLTPVTVPEPVYFVNNGESEEVLVAHLSDWQLGEVVDFEHTLGIGHYNSNIACHRIRYIFERIVEMAENRRTVRKVRKLVLMIGGDMVHNDTMRGSAKSHADFEISMQMSLFSRILIEMILLMLRHFDIVEVEMVEGNHGRNGRPGENHPMSNYDYMAYERIREVIHAIVRDRNRVRINCPYSMFINKDIMGKNYLLFHGESIRGWMGIPFYGAIRTKSNLDKLFGLIGEKFDNMFVGHHHTYADWEDSAGEIVMNGSTVGPSTFSVDCLTRGSRASQNVFFVDEDGLGLRDRIKLDHIKGDLPNILDRYVQPEFIDIIYSEGIAA